MASGGWWWPSLGWPSLPNFDSFNTRHWQRRLLRFVIKRTLTGFLKIPEDDIEQSTYLDADLGSGSLKLRDVELDQQAINQAVAKQLGHGFPLEVCLQSGSISSVQILVGTPDAANGDRTASEPEPSRRISATERLFTAPIHTVVKDVVLDFRIQPARATSPDNQEEVQDHCQEDTGHAFDLGASILHVAESYIHEDQREGEGSVDGDDEPFGLPGGFGFSSGNAGTSQLALNEQQQVGLIANIVETLLGRLCVVIDQITINLFVGTDLQLRIRLGRFETNTEAKTTDQTRSSVRSVEVSGFEIHALIGESPLKQPPVPFASGRSRRTSSSSSSASTGSSDDLAMSMAIADLRSSKTASAPTADQHFVSYLSPDNERSLYLDAESYIDKQRNANSSQGFAGDEPVSASEFPRKRDESSEPWQHILGLFSENSDGSPSAEISVRAVKTYISSALPASRQSGDRNTAATSQSSSSRIELKLPVVALSLSATFVQSLGTFLTGIPHSSSKQTLPAKAKETSSSVSDTLVYVQMQALHVFCHLGSNPGNLADLVQTVSNPVSRPSSKFLYTFLKIVEGVYRLDDKNAKLAIHDFGFCTSHQGNLQPILLCDPGLLWQYAPESLRPGEEHTTIPNTWPPDACPDLRDWRCGLPVSATSMTAGTRLPLLQDGFAARLSNGDMTVNLQPLHIWLNAEAMDEIMQDILTTQVLEVYGNYVATRATHGSEISRTPAQTDQRETVLSLTIPCVRVDVRCPTLPSTEQAIYGDLRSGIITLALHDITYHSDSATVGATLGNDAKCNLGLELACLFVFLAERPGEDMRSILYAGKARANQSTAIVLCSYSCGLAKPVKWGIQLQIPFVDIALDKSDIDAIQYLIDDITRVASRAGLLTGMATSAFSAYEADQVGSHTSRIVPTQPSRSPTEVDNQLGEVQSHIDKLQIRLRLPRGMYDEQTSRSLDIEVTTLSVTAVLPQIAADGLLILTSLNDVKIVERTLSRDSSRDRLLLQRDSSTQTPCLQFRLASSVAGQARKRTNVSVDMAYLTITCSSDTSLVNALGSMLKPPPGAFVDVIPTETTSIDLRASHLTIKIVPRTLTSSIAAFCEGVSFSTKLKHGASSTRCRGTSRNMQLWIADCPREGLKLGKTFKDLGYAQLLYCKSAATSVKISSEPVSHVAITVELGKTQVTACPDTLICMSAFAGDFAAPSEPRPMKSDQSHAAMSESLVLPRDGFVPQEESRLPPTNRQVVSALDGDTIELCSQNKIRLDRHWLHNIKTAVSSASSTPAFTFRLKPSQLTLSLYEGYDFDRTRAFVKSAVKATRRRLEKIKQLLADGQMPEQTVEEVADPLLQSIFLPARPRRQVQARAVPDEAESSPQEMDAMMRIVAFDDELDQDGDSESDSMSVWETLTDRPAAPRRGSSSSSRTPASNIVRSNRLKRPRYSAIDIHCSDIEASMQGFGPDASIASRLQVRIGDLSIVDNIKTSTWNKFLTELRPRDGGVTRPTGSPMLRIVLKMLQTGNVLDGEEADLYVKVAPLRLHIDQDALDFLKTFFAFKMDLPLPLSDKSATARSDPPIENRKGGFIQRVEIAAVKVKLDYKPKRVDYHALRQGRAIEMMNFFHFEASEMVLRHLVLSGIADWAKVGDKLQEIWTPDVKANQLADFLAGINPVRSVVNVGHGLADLVLLPVAQYKKDGRLTRGLQRGGSRFAKSTAMEAIRLGARLATGTQVILEHAEHVLGGRIDVPAATDGSSTTLLPAAGPGRSEWLLTTTEDASDEEEPGRPGNEPLSKFSQQPEDVKIGLQTAYRSLSGNVRSAAETILAVPMEVYERSNEGPVRAVVRAVPIAVLKPMIGASEAVSKTLLGLRNTLDPGAKEEVEDKYKRR